MYRLIYYPFRLLSCALFLIAANSLSAQVNGIAINDDNSSADVSAILDVNINASSSKKGLLIPRVTSTQRDAIVLPANSLLIFNTSTNWFEYNEGTPASPNWVPLLSSITGWRTIGNTGTSPGTNFIGTTDNAGFLFKINNSYAGYLDNSFVTNNLYLGLYSGNYGTSTGIYNIALGASALASNTSGGMNTAIGQAALYSNTNGWLNTAIGQSALGTNTSGTGNTAIGQAALNKNTTGSSNLAFGGSALRDNTTASQNIAIGQNTMSTNVTGAYNVAIGNNAMSDVLSTTVTANVAIGNNALQINRADYNTAAGYLAMTNNTTGANNASLGYSALSSNTTGGNNTALGYRALYGNTTGSNNIAIGYQANNTDVTASNSILIGYNAASSNSNAVVVGASAQANNSQATAIGNAAQANGSNSAAIGNEASTSQSNAFILGNNSVNVGIGTSTPNTSAKLDVNGSFKLGSTGTVTKNSISFSVSVSSTTIAAPTTSILTILGLNVLGSYAAGVTDVTVTIPSSSYPSGTQGTVVVSPAFDLPGSVAIASARLISTSQVKIRFLNAGSASQSLSGTLYITITEF